MLKIKLQSNTNHTSLINTLHHTGAFTGDWDVMQLAIPSGTFIQPGALAWLCTWGLQQRAAGRAFIVTGDRRALNFPARQHLFHHLAIEYEASTRARDARRNAATSYIPLLLVDDGASIKQAVDAICDLVLRNLDNAGDFLPALEWAVNEMVDNIGLHADADVPGAVCARYYASREQLEIGICDVGQGILNSLSQSHVLADHQEALRKALERGVTRSTEAGMGNGLAGAQTISRTNMGRFELWSGDALYSLQSNRTRRIPFVPGTGIFFSLNTDVPVRLGQLWIGEREYGYLHAESERLAKSGGFVVADECVNVGTREPAKELRRRIHGLLSVHDAQDGPLVLDFAGVNHPSSSFLDELLGRLAEELGEAEFGHQIRANNMSRDEGHDVQQMADVVIAQRLHGVNPAQIHAELESGVVRDLYGPFDGPEEIVDERGGVRARYLVGMLAPKGQSALPEEMDDLATSGVDGQDGITDAPPSRATASMLPRSMGLTFAVNDEAESIVIQANWGHYKQVTIEDKAYQTESGEFRPVWQRTQMASTSESIPLMEGRMEEWFPAKAEQPLVYVQGLMRRVTLHDITRWHVTLFLVNGQEESKKNDDGADSVWLFQPELVVRAPDQAPIFEKRLMHAPDEHEEAQMLAMLYRRHIEFAVGHGVAVHPVLADQQHDRAIRLETRVLPIYEVPQTTAPTADEVPALSALTVDMKALSQVADGQFRHALGALSTAYGDWIDQLRQRLDVAQGLKSGQQHNSLLEEPDLPPSDLLDLDLLEHLSAARRAIDQCQRTLARIEAGITLLDSNAQAAQAFRFANDAMYRQRIQSIYASKVRQGEVPDWAEIDVPQNHQWRTFQLAFLLLNLTALVDPTHSERMELADLIWFPTGGGKTEAYLGVAACALALRRLQGVVKGADGTDYSGHAGVGVLMRYTLRLLTLQQFQRAAALICACEKIRRDDVATWRSEPFRIGLWVGRNTTPNRTEDASEAIASARNSGAPGGSGSPHQLTNCPWCGSDLDPGRDIIVEPVTSARGRTLVYCSDPKGRCPFSEKQAKGEGIPVLTVDEEIYRRLPALLIATVDKFAQMPWNGRTAMLFGRVDGYCERHGFRSPELDDSDSHLPSKKFDLPAAKTIPAGPLRPPDLIIQDELHLISGPLGSLVGLYETAVDELCTWTMTDATGNAHAVRPKVIASTATVRQAAEQVHGLFMRQLNIFPPQGLDVGDNFFARQRSTSDEPDALPGRRYLGINAPGIRHKTALIRTYTSLLSTAQALYEKYGKAADPWMTLVGYFNSLRELGGMRRAVDDSVSARLRRMNERGQTNRPLNPYSVEELTSRLSATDIPAKLDQLSRVFDPDEKKGRRRGNKRNGSRAKPRQQHPIDVLLATNMISVGVDVSRLGLMVCAGQPKNTSEYIQATSRVGRDKSGSGLVCMVYNWTRPRDLSHYESFAHYHATFYQHVEALSVTPFSAGAMKRGLSALLVAQLRLGNLDFNPNLGAEHFAPDDPRVQAALASIIQRAGLVVDSAHEALVTDALTARVDVWAQLIRHSVGARVGYSQQGAASGLLSDAEAGRWELFTCLNSLRNVEPTVKLMLNDYGMDRGEERPWPTPHRNDEDAGETNSSATDKQPEQA